MKKAKRFLTGLLSAALALSLCAMPAMADDGVGTPPATTANPVWTKDTGSITIHKYEWNGKAGDPATGREDENQLPSEKDGENTKIPNQLAGAEFTIYQVHDADWLSKYYSGAATEAEEAEYKTAFDATTYYTGDNGTYTVNSTYTAYATDKTNNSGTVTFNKVTVKNSDDSETKDVPLPLGLYLVIETKTPDQVTTPCQPFLVSVPMTVKENDKDSKYVPTEWLYDVHVYPKNKTDYGNITLIKKGQVGNDAANETLSGVTFKLYKFVGTKGTNGEISPFTAMNNTDVEDTTDTTKVWKQIKRSSTAAGDNTGTEFGADGLLTTGSAGSDLGKITVSGLSKGYYCFVEQDVGDNKAFITDQTPHYFEVKGNTSQEITVADDGTVTEKADSTAAANLELTVTDPRPDVEKKVKDRAPAENGDEYVEASDYSVGDEIPYKITVKVPQALLNATVTNATDFVFEVKDTPEHLEDKNVQAISSTGEVVTTGVKITPDSKPNDKGGIGFTASFTQDALKALVGEEGDTFTITYTATLLKGADMTVNGNKNTINLKYSNKIDADGKINPDTSEIEDGAVVYTFSIHVDKRGEKKDGDALPGVKFNVYKEVAKGTDGAVEGSTIGLTGVDAKKYFVKVVIDGTKTDGTKYDLVTGPDGKAQVDGLANGTYYLVETATVNGYNLLSGPVKVTIHVSYFKSWTVKNEYVGDTLVHQKETEYEEYFGGSEGDPKNGYTLTTIINRKGFNLPTTGGFGTLLFSGIGVLLVVAGVGVLLSLKKKNRA